MRISDFGRLDPDGDPGRHQNWTHWSLGHALPLQEISSKSVHNFFQLSNEQTDRHTDRQTDKQTEVKTTSFDGGNDLLLEKDWFRSRLIFMVIDIDTVQYFFFLVANS